MSSFFLFVIAMLISVGSFAQQSATVKPSEVVVKSESTIKTDSAVKPEVAKPESATTSNPVNIKPGPRYDLCRIGREVRSLRIKMADSGVCTAFYTKEGVDQNVGESSDFNTCHKVIERIRKNLEVGGWVCKDVSTERVSFSN